MAILDVMPGVKVEIQIDGKAIKEHQDADYEEDDEYHVTRYIEASPGQEFVVRVELLPNFEFEGDAVGFDIYVDGVCVDSPLLPKNEDDRHQVSGGAHVGGGMVEKYRFANIETVNDGRIRDNEKLRARDLGTIRVECDHYQQGSEVDNYTWKTAELDEIVSEKALKRRAIDQKIELTQAQKSADGETPKNYDAKLLDDPDPSGEFIFHYRSLAALQSMLIIPRTPSPPSLEERDPTTLTPDELKELQKWYLGLRSQNETRLKVKREEADDNPRPRKVSKPQAGDTLSEVDEDGSVRESSTATFGGPAVIELD